MRHFLRSELVPTLAIAGLACGLKASRPETPAVQGRCPMERISPLHALAQLAEALTPVTTGAESKLNSTPLAGREPVRLRLRSSTFGPGRRAHKPRTIACTFQARMSQADSPPVCSFPEVPSLRDGRGERVQMEAGRTRRIARRLEQPPGVTRIGEGF